ncbi:MAG: DUF1385 domain-containing protein [Clostridia bacterium]|nr:DUF1385 domain-containing protein [Clostridia bacterium]
MANNKHVQEAESNRDGIIFHSNTVQGMGVKTYFNEQNEICSITAPIQFLRGIEQSKIKKTFKFSETKLQILLSGLIIILGILSASIHEFFISLFFTFFALPNLLSFFRVWYMYKRKSSPFYKVSQFHSAEHMVISAYAKLQRIPTLEEVKNSSRISKHCGSNSMFLKLIYGVTLCIIYALFGGSNTLAYPIGLAILLLFCFLCTKYQVHRGLQYLILSTPTDEQLQLSIEAIKNFESMEEKVENGGIDAILDSFMAALPSMLGHVITFKITSEP